MALKNITRTITRHTLSLCLALYLALCPAIEFKGAARAAGQPPPPPPNMESQIPVTGYNIILLIDASYSATLIDQDHLVANTADIFLDALYARDGSENMGMPDSRVGVVAFSSEASTVQSLVPITTDENAKFIKGKLKNNIPYSPSESKDIGVGILKALDELQMHADSSRKNMIVLLTNGQDVAESANSSASISQRGMWTLDHTSDGGFQPFPPQMDSLERAKQKAREMGCEIYVVGLDFPDNHSKTNISEASWNQLREIANFTQTGSGIVSQDSTDPNLDAISNPNFGRAPGTTQVNCQRVKDYRDIRKFYASLFASMARTGGIRHGGGMDVENGHGYYNIEVDSLGISWVKLFLYFNGELPLNQIDLRNPRNPDGPSVNIDGSSIWTRRDGSGYMILTIERPEVGVWRLGSTGNSFEADYVLMGGVELELRAEQISGSVGRVTVTATNNGVPLDASFYENLSSKTFTVMSANNNGGPPPMGGNPPPMGNQPFETGVAPNWQSAGGPPFPGPPDGNPPPPPPSAPYDLTPSADVGNGVSGLTGDFSVNSPGAYTITANLGTSQLQHTESASVNFRLDNVPLRISVPRNGERTVTISNEIGWNNLIILLNSAETRPLAAQSGAEDAEPAEILLERVDREINGVRQYTDLKITHVRAGADVGVELHVIYNNNQSATLHGVVSVGGNFIDEDSTRILIAPVLILVLLLLILAAALLIRLLFFQRVRGVFTVTCACGGVKMSREIVGPRGAHFSLYKLLVSLIDQAEESGEDIGSLRENLDSVRGELTQEECAISIQKDIDGVKTYFIGQGDSAASLRSTWESVFDPRGISFSVSVAFEPE